MFCVKKCFHFFDDIQSADYSSLDEIKMLVLTGETENLIFIVVYWIEELDKTLPVMTILKQFAESVRPTRNTLVGDLDLTKLEHFGGLHYRQEKKLR